MAQPDNDSQGRSWWPPSVERLQLLAAVLGVVTSIILAVTRSWVFHSPAPTGPADKEPSLWRFLLSDRTTLGFFRLGIIALAIYGVASIPALIAGGRWIKGFGVSGLTADDQKKGTEDLERAKSELEEAKRQRDDAVRLAKELEDL